MIFIIKVTTNKEERAVDMIAERAIKKQLNVYTVSRPHGLRGYILLEAEDRESAEEAAFNLPYVKGIVGKTISYEEIQKSPTYSSGYALRFPRVTALREDKPADEVNDLKEVEYYYEQQRGKRN